MATVHPASGTGLRDDFVYHLYRGSDLLMQDRLTEARYELERALDMQPEDERGQGMLAGAYFRLGMYPLAVEVYEKLAQRHASDPILQLNLGLSLLRASSPQKAIRHLRFVVDAEPDHLRAWKYLGTAYWQLGQMQEAYAAFTKAGADELIARVKTHLERQVAEAHAGIASPPGLEFSGTLPKLGFDSTRPETWPLSENRTLAPSNISGVRSRHVSHAPARNFGDVAAAGRDSNPWLVSPGDDNPIVIAPDGSLRISTHQAPVVARTSHMVAIEGDIQSERLPWRCFGRPQAQRGASAHDDLSHLRGAARIVMAPGPKRSYYAVKLHSSSPVVLREASVAAFCGNVEHEHSYLPSGGETPMLQLRGDGTVFLVTDAPPSLLSVIHQRTVRIHSDMLIGWSGDVLVMAGATAPKSMGESPAWLCFRGDGMLFARFRPQRVS